MVTSEAENGNIFEVEVTMNPPDASDASTATPEADDSKNEEVKGSSFDAVATIQPGKVAVTPDDLVDLQACVLEINNNNQLVPENAEPPNELEVNGEWVLP